MDAYKQSLYWELREIREELINTLKSGNSSPLIRPLIEDELKDVDETITKLEAGIFGICEMSGEFLPKSALMMIPTIRSLDDVSNIKQFYCKSIHS